MDDSKQWNRPSNKNNNKKRKTNWKWKLSNPINNNANLIKIPNKTIIIIIIVLCWFSEIYRRFVYAVRIKEKHSKWKRFFSTQKSKDSIQTQFSPDISSDFGRPLFIYSYWSRVALHCTRIHPYSVYVFSQIYLHINQNRIQVRGTKVTIERSIHMSLELTLTLGYILRLRLVTMVQVHCISYQFYVLLNSFKLNNPNPIVISPWIFFIFWTKLKSTAKWHT